MTIEDLFKKWWTLKKPNATITDRTTITVKSEMPNIAGTEVYILSRFQVEDMRRSMFFWMLLAVEGNVLALFVILFK